MKTETLKLQPISLTKPWEHGHLPTIRQNRDHLQQLSGVSEFIQLWSFDLGPPVFSYKLHVLLLINFRNSMLAPTLPVGVGGVEMKLYNLVVWLNSIATAANLRQWSIPASTNLTRPWVQSLRPERFL